MTHTAIPSDLIAGDSYSIDLSPSAYSASDWSLTFYLRGKSVLDVTATASGTGFNLTLTPTKTANLPAGLYNWSVVVTSSTERHTISTGTLTVFDNLAHSGTKISHAEKMLAAIEAVIEGRITDDVQQVSIAGRSITNIPIDQLMEYRTLYTKELTFLKGGTAVKRRSIPFVLH